MKHGAIPWPQLIDAVDRHGHNRGREVVGENGRSLLERLHSTVDRAFSLGEQHQHFAVPQTESARLHRRHEARVGVDRDHAREPGQPCRERRLEVLARSHEEQLAEDTERQRPGDEKRVDVALVIRADQIRPASGQVLAAAYLEPQKQPGDAEQLPERHEEQHGGDGPRLQ